MKFIIALFLFFYSINFYTQKNSFNTKWFLNKTVNCSTNKPINDSKWNIEFDTLNKALITFNNLGLKKEVNYTINDSLLKVNDIFYEVKKVTIDTLMLSINNNKICKTYIFESKLFLNKKQKQKYFTHNGELVFYTNKINSPKLNGSSNLLHYFSNSFQYGNTQNSKCNVTFYFIITKTGALIEPRGSISCLKKSNKKIIEILEKTKNKWTPMFINNTAVNSFVRIHFKHNVEIH
ncbi:hypothetical protein SAMN05444411_102589 [Lutibacter oricola]|uniref:TonB protein C-terminal n=1 Tax=Lutibacter oricola TaxID=762486 RepID=A0A1H2XZ77_9FLAO|nr:hypothetical protein [Lutibacter oricola]SDW97888.1 hypothetical protein SAMN05444411_102589 [Lutibacter oricola]